MRANRQLKSVVPRGFDMTKIAESDARPGGWKTMLLQNKNPEHKQRHEPAIIDDAIVEGAANGVPASELEKKFETRVGYVRDVLRRKFGSLEVVKNALASQCFENAVALNEHAMSRLDQIAPGQALVGAKIMIDGGLALEKQKQSRPTTIDFGALAALGETLERIEKQVQGTDKTV